MNEESTETPKQAEIRQLLEYVKVNYPTIEPLVQGRLNHFKRRMAGGIGIAIVACEVLQLVLG